MDTTFVYTFLVGLLLGHTVRVVARSGRVGEAYTIARTLRPGDFARNLPTLAAAIAVAAVLSQVPALAWGWTQLLGGEGNVLLGGGSDSTIVPLVVIGVLLVILPVLALLEEQAFRAGSEYRSRNQRWAWAIFFGAAHTLVGVPLAGVVALTLAGWWFTNRYLHGYRNAESRYSDERREAALAAATRAHLAWNYTLVVTLWVSLVL